MASIKTRVPTRSPTHEDIEIRRLSSMGLELEELADSENGTVELAKLVELAEDRGRPASHYLAAIPLATELTLAMTGPVTVRVCAGTCQRYGALDILDALVDRISRSGPGFVIAPVTCLDRCDQAAACEIDGAHGKLVVAPATPASILEAIGTLTS